jgi:hypothetical protein
MTTHESTERKAISGANRLLRAARLLFLSENGESLVTFALTLPTLLGFIFGIMQVCVAYYTYQWMSESAREGTRYAMVRGSTCETSGGSSCEVSASEVTSYVNGLGLPNIGGGIATVLTTYPDGDEAPGHRVQVTITYAFPYKIPFVMSKSLTMTSESVMRIIQ